MTRRPILLSLAVLAAAAGYAACAGDEPETPVLGSSGSGGVGGGASGAGASGGGASGAGASGGGASGGDAGDAAWVAPVFKPASPLAGCKVDEIDQAAPEAEAWRFAPCSFSADSRCEEARMAPFLVDATPLPPHTFSIVPTTNASDDGSSVMIGLTADWSGADGHSLVVDVDGRIKAGVRVAITAACGVVVTSTFGSRYAGFVSGGGKKYGGFFGDVAGGARSIVPMLDVPAAGGPQGYSLGPMRWAWSMYPGSNATMSAADGSGFTSFATADPAKGPIVEVGDPVAAGGGFLTSEAVIDGQSSRPRIVFSVDGVSSAKPLVPLDASGGEDATAVYAHTHLAWLRGFGKKDLNLYDKVEVWSSPWADEPGAVKPTPTAPVSIKNVSVPATAFAGGWGRVALNDGGVLRVVSLATKDQTLPPLPEGEHVALVLGVTRTHVWYGTASAKSTTVRRLFRYALP